MTSKFNCFGPGFLPGFLKWVYPKNPPGFFLGTCPGVRTLFKVNEVGTNQKYNIII